MQVQFWAATDVGLTRDHNEDNYLVDPNLHLFVVADGMGGHAAGEIASSVAVHEVREAIKKQKEVVEGFKKSGSVLQRQTVLTLLEQAILTACKSVYQCAQEDSERHGMGTTLSLLLLARNRAFVGHVGDSRIYRTREGKVSQITEDHTVINELIKSGRIKPNEAFNSPYKNAVTRAVGVHPSVEVDTFDFEVQSGDNYLLCSDGLSGYLDEDQGPFSYLSRDEIKEIPKALIDFANESGGKDNITAIVIRIDELEQPKMSTSFGMLPPLPNTSVSMHESELDELDELEAEESLVGFTDEGIPSLEQDDEQEPPPLPQQLQKDKAHSTQIPSAQIASAQTVSAQAAGTQLDHLPINLLKVSPLFALLNDELIEALVSLAEVIKVEANSPLLLKGDEDDALYFLFEGELRVEDDESQVSHLTVGAMLGEDQLLIPTAQAFHVLADADCQLLRWRSEALHLLMSRSPEISARIMWGLALLNQRKIERLNRSLLMVNEMFTQTLEQYVPKDHPVQSSWREESKTLIASTPSSLEVYTPLERMPEFVQDLPKIPKASFEISLKDAQDMLDAEQDE